MTGVPDTPAEDPVTVVEVQRALSTARRQLEAGSVGIALGFAELFFEVTNILGLQASLLYLRTEEPRQRANGTFPLKNDYFFTLGVSLTLG